MSWAGTACLLTYFVIISAVKCEEKCNTGGRTNQDPEELEVSKSVDPDLQVLDQGPRLKGVDGKILIHPSVYRAPNYMAYDHYFPSFYTLRYGGPIRDSMLLYGTKRRLGGRRKAQRAGRKQFLPQVLLYPQNPMQGSWGETSNSSAKGRLGANFGADTDVAGQSEENNALNGYTWGN